VPVSVTTYFAVFKSVAIHLLLLDWVVLQW